MTASLMSAAPMVIIKQPPAGTLAAPAALPALAAVAVVGVAAALIVDLEEL